jgi:hypothetical protein
MIVVIASVLAACAGNVDPRWQLDHDRIVAVRATPSHIPAGASATIDGLVAHAGASTDVEAPTIVGALGPLASAVQPDGTIVAPSDDVLDGERARLDLPAGAPVPLQLGMEFGALEATKTIYLGDAVDDPPLPAIAIAGAPPGDSLAIAFDTDVPLAADADPTWMVSWLSSCGTLHDDDEHAAFVHVKPGDSTSGQLAVVVRDTAGGVVWSVWPIASTP